jgi:aminoglycoside/choline kinase family phosphotransferase
MSISRQEKQQAFVKQHFAEIPWTLTRASSDASFRQYYRITLPTQGETRILMDAPPDKEDCRPFVSVGQSFRQHGLYTPDIYAADLEQGFLLLEDFGNKDYLSQLTLENVDRLYGQAMEKLLRLQQLNPEQVTNLPDYNGAILDREMALFPTWLLGKHLAWPENRFQQIYQDFADFLREAILKHPKIVVHLDYHSRNLMLLDDTRQRHNPGILDFQDARFGSYVYDLVSLLRDCYIAWPAEQVYTWLKNFARESQPELQGADWERDFDWMGCQRHLKAAGIFARLYHRDGKDGYLKDIPRTVGYLRQICEKYADIQEFAAFGALLKDFDDAAVVQTRNSTADQQGRGIQ